MIDFDHLWFTRFIKIQKNIKDTKVTKFQINVFGLNLYCFKKKAMMYITFIAMKKKLFVCSCNV